MEVTEELPETVPGRPRFREHGCRGFRPSPGDLSSCVLCTRITTHPNVTEKVARLEMIMMDVVLFTPRHRTPS